MNKLRNLQCLVILLLLQHFFDAMENFPEQLWSVSRGWHRHDRHVSKYLCGVWPTESQCPARMIFIFPSSLTISSSLSIHFIFNSFLIFIFIFFSLVENSERVSREPRISTRSNDPHNNRKILFFFTSFFLIHEKSGNFHFFFSAESFLSKFYFIN